MEALASGGLCRDGEIRNVCLWKDRRHLPGRDGSQKVFQVVGTVSVKVQREG